ncbi:unnamed protein product [Moneuplotes crassus]|uniref:Importin N-terminal domain-containing protein n=1 Tax=Euplotes crassus TaxID=5936 RepID=A0AAD1UR90_EUPCR|nr:unnamed protein product [Moneuplotes crassus]
MDQTELKEFETLANAIANPSAAGSSSGDYQKANEALNAYTSVLDNWDKIQSVLQLTQDPNALFFAAISLKNLFADNWTKVSKEKKIDIVSFCIEFLKEKGPDCKREVLNAVIMLMVKVAKLSWFDDQSHQDSIKMILGLLGLSIGHCFIGVLALEQMIIEMTYINKGKTLIQSRRISVSFRDKFLLSIFGTVISLLNELQPKISANNSGPDSEIIRQALFHCCSLAHKCLNFEFLGVLLDETILESIGTHFPLSWRDTIENFDNTKAFFAIVQTPTLTEDTYILALQSLGELASCRITIFENATKRKEFVHNFARSLSELIKNQSEFFCSSRSISRHYIKLFHKFEMNFQVRSFGPKSDDGKLALRNYLSDLAEFTILVIKSGQSYLREIAIYLLATWNRINIEAKSEPGISTKIQEIVVTFIEQSISDLSDDQEEEDDEHFNEKELKNLTQRFETIAITCDIHISPVYNCLNEGLTFLMERYSQELENNNQELLELIEKRFAWVIRVVCAMMNRGFAPKYPAPDSNEPKPEGQDECDACIKIIDIIKKNVELNLSQTHKMSELFELAALSFMSIFRSSILCDARVIAKCISEDQEETTFNTGCSYLRIAGIFDSKDILGVVEIFFKKIILNLFTESKPIIEQNISMMNTFVQSSETRKYLMALETTQDLMENHFTKYAVLNTLETVIYLRKFYKVLSIFWEVNDHVDNFYNYMKPVTEFIRNLLEQSPSDLALKKEDILRALEILNGVSCGFKQPEAFNKFYIWFNQGPSKIIHLVFENFCDDKIILKSAFRLMKSLLDNSSSRFKPQFCYINGFMMFKEFSEIIMQYFNYVNMYIGVQITGDKYDDKYEFINLGICILGNLIAGNYINFSILEYYNDTTFIDLCKVIMTLITTQDHGELASFKSLCKNSYKIMEDFLKHHSDMMVRHFEPSLTIKVIEFILLGLMTENNNKGRCCNALRDLISHIYASRNILLKEIEEILKIEEPIFKEILKTLLTTVIYEEHKVIWVFQKPLFPTIVLNGRENYEIVKNEIISNETSPELRSKIDEELSQLCNDVFIDSSIDYEHGSPNEISLSKANKDKFTTNFSRFKNSLIKFK